MAQQAAPPSTPYGAPITFAAAKKAMAAAEAEAAKNNWGVAIAIVDSGANLVMLHRLDNAQLSSVRIAEAKGAHRGRVPPPDQSVRRRRRGRRRRTSRADVRSERRRGRRADRLRRQGRRRHRRVGRAVAPGRAGRPGRAPTQSNSNAALSDVLACGRGGPTQSRRALSGRACDSSASEPPQRTPARLPALQRLPSHRCRIRRGSRATGCRTRTADSTLATRLRPRGTCRPADICGMLAEHLRHDIGYFVVAQHVPFREAAHHRRTDGIDHPADPRLADRKRAHRARLDVGIDRAVGEVACGREFAAPRKSR